MSVNVARKSAYRYLLYAAMLDIRIYCQSRGEPRRDPAIWERQYHTSRVAGGIADWLHNLAKAAADDFERFNEDDFWKTHDYFCKQFPGELERYRSQFEQRLKDQVGHEGDRRNVQQLHDWLDRKLHGPRYGLRVPANATEVFRRSAGPRSLFGQVKISAIPAKEFSYSSRAAWPTGEQIQMYEDCVLEGILDAVMVHNSVTVMGVAVTLEEIAWHEIDSCAFGYRMAAQHAMKLVLGAGGYELVSPLSS